MVWSPGVKPAVLKDAAPLVKGTCARVFAPSWKVTIPVGPGEPPVTVAVKITVCPGRDGFGDEVRFVAVANAWTF
jgi:hypothetical protein